MALTAKQFHEGLWGPSAESTEVTGGEIVSPPAPSVYISPQERGRHASERLTALGREHGDLSHLLGSARLDNANEEHRGYAMQQVLDMFGKPPSEQRVALPKELIEKFGGMENVQFGVQEISSPEQLASLQRDVERAKAHFTGMELHTVTDRKGRQMAVVMGIDAQEFNAVTEAYHKRDALGREMDTAREELNKQMGRSTEQAQEKPVEPPQDLAARVAMIQSMYPGNSASGREPQTEQTVQVTPPGQTPAVPKDSVREMA